jgi:hypothetical protein
MIGIGRWHDLIASILQFFLEHVTDEKFVFDDQDSWHGRPPRGAITGHDCERTSILLSNRSGPVNYSADSKKVGPDFRTNPEGGLSSVPLSVTASCSSATIQRVAWPDTSSIQVQRGGGSPRSESCPLRLIENQQPLALFRGGECERRDHVLERYLARTRGLAEQAIFNFENSPRTKFANQLQTSTTSDLDEKENVMPIIDMDGAPRPMKMGTIASP